MFRSCSTKVTSVSSYMNSSFIDLWLNLLICLREASEFELCEDNSGVDFAKQVDVLLFITRCKTNLAVELFMRLCYVSNKRFHKSGYEFWQHIFSCWNEFFFLARLIIMNKCRPKNIFYNLLCRTFN